MSFKRKSEISVLEAAKLAYNYMPAEFSALYFASVAKEFMKRYLIHDGTILRRLREIRAKNTGFNYRVIDNERSIYQKI